MTRLGALLLLMLPLTAAGGVESVTRRVDELLRHFETTATYHNVALDGLDAARRSAALGLVELAHEALSRGEGARAELLLGLAVDFPELRWYESHLNVDEYRVLIRAREAVADWQTEASGVPVAPRVSVRRTGERAPYIPPYQTEEWMPGQYRNRIDLTHFPDRRAEVRVMLGDKLAGRGELTPPDKFVYARTGTGSYRITVGEGADALSFDYPALAVKVVDGELSVNGRPYPLRAINAATLSEIDAAVNKQASAVVLTEPSKALLRDAAESGLAVVVRPLRLEDDFSRVIAKHGGTTSALQAALRDRLELYTQFGGVWLWDLGARGLDCETLAETMLGPVFAQCAPLSRPRAEQVKEYAP